MELELSHVLLSVIKISVSDRNVHLDDFYFFQVNESTLYDFESLSFANKINDQRLSLVYQFYKQGLIDNPSFGFLSTNFGNGNLIQENLITLLLVKIDIVLHVLLLKDKTHGDVNLIKL